MSDKEAGIRELKTHLSRYLRDVKSGMSLVVTEHGEPIAQIVPIGQPLKSKLDQMREAGLAEWSGEPLEISDAAVDLAEGTKASDAIVEEREARGGDEP